MSPIEGWELNGRSSAWRTWCFPLICLLVIWIWPTAELGPLRRSLVLVALTLFFGLPCGAILGLALGRFEFPGQCVARGGMYALLTTPLVIQAAAWQACLGRVAWPSAGVLSELLISRGLVWAALVHASAAIPWIALFVSWRVRAFSGDPEDEAELDASPWRVARLVTLPRVSGSLLIAAVWIAWQTLGEITVTDLFQVRTYAEELYVGYALGDPATGMPPLQYSLGWGPPLLLGMLLFSLAIPMMKELHSWPIGSPFDARPRRVNLRLRKSAFAGWIAWSLLACLVVPCVGLILKAGWEPSVDSLATSKWSFLKAISLMGRSLFDFRREWLWTAIISQVVALLGLAIAILFTFRLRLRHWTGILTCGLVAGTMAIPSVTIGLALSRIFSEPWGGWWPYLYDQTILAPVLALLFRTIPLQMLILWQGLASIPAEQHELADMAGAGPWRRLWAVQLPQLGPAACTAWLVGILVAAGDLTTSVLVMPPGTTTLTIRIFGLLHAGVEDRLASVCLTAMTIFAGFGLVLEKSADAWDDGEFGPARTITFSAGKGL